MTWFRIDDGFYDHPKAFDASDAAVALWTRAGSWSARNLTDGFVPAGMLPRLSNGAEEASRELCDRGLWRRTRGGFQFHDWHDYNRSAEEVKSERKANTERQKRWREAQRNARSNASSNAVTDASTNGVTNGTPTRPDPTIKEDSLRSSSPRKRGTRIPDDFAVSAEMVEWAREHAPEVDGRLATAAFVDYWRGRAGKDGVKLDWPATWRNWMRREQQSAAERRARASPNGVNRTDANIHNLLARSQSPPNLLALPGGAS